MNYYRDTFEITGFKGDGDVYCVDCACARYPLRQQHHVVDREGNEVYPVFLADEWSYQVRCSDCGEQIDITLTLDG